MISDFESRLAEQAASAATPGPVKGHFDTFETKFFEQGEDGAKPGGEIERFDDLDDPAKRKGFAPSRRFVLGVAAASAALAILGCVALWRSRVNPHVVASVAAEPTPSAPVMARAEPTPTPSAPAMAQADPTPTPAPPPQAQPAPAPAAAGIVAATPEPEPVPAAGPVPSKPAPEATPPAPPAAVVAQAAPVPAPPAPPVVKTEPVSAPVGGADESPVRDTCKKAIKERRNKEILGACAEAFATNPRAAEFAVALARTEFDRGHSAQALSWGRKAVAVNPNAADAYVFIGGAEQNAGHGKAAKEAYTRYLQLAPTGRYAADLRAVVGSL